MFFEGTLQDGLSAAVQQSKQVVCFVTDGDSESELWEHDFLTEDSIKNALATTAVSLRLVAESEEEAFLAAMFPLPRKPTLLVLQTGQLREYITAGTSKEDFQRRLSAALSDSNKPANPIGASEASAGQTQSQQAPERTLGSTSDTATSPAPATSPPALPTQQQRIQALLAERAKRMVEERKAQEAEAKAKAEKEARAKDRQAPEPQPSSSSSSARQSHAERLRRQKQENKEAKERILKRIEDDRRERKEREAQDRQARLLLSAIHDKADVSSSRNNRTTQQQQPPVSLRNHGGGPICNLQVRLLDGSTLRAQFPSTSTLATDVRQWVDASRTDGDAPYQFKILLTPLPSQNVASGEEGQELRELGLTPSATLILVPVARVATAFPRSGGGGGILWRGWTALYALVALLAGIPRLLLGGRARGARNDGAVVGDIGGIGADRRGAGIPLDNLDGAGGEGPDRDREGERIRGFRNPDDRARDQELYNGNSLNFEPRRDEDDP